MRLTGLNAVVTGSTSGIGWGIASALAEQGCNIMLNGLGDPKEIEKIRTTMAEQYQVRVDCNTADMTKPDQIRDLIAVTTDRFGQVDILVNNAGIQYTARIEDFPPEHWDRVIAINLSAVFHSSAAVLPQMRSRNWGRIINIASVHGLVGSIEKAAYIAAKHGVVGLTKVTALETAETGITANAICPGWVLTSLVQQQIKTRAEKQGISIEQASRNLVSEKQPSKQFVTPEQLGAMVVFLCSAAADQMTGQPVTMDGGWVAQ